MSLGFRVLDGHERSEPSLVEAFAAIPTAIISDNLSRMVAAGPKVRPMHKSGVMAGTAVTVKTRPGDNLMIHKAADMIREGDVIVVDAGGDLTNALIGELIISHARSRGAVGFVVNGAVRDMDVVGADTFPVYGAGVSHRGPYKDGPGEVNVPISLDGMLVEPGDIIIGDLDGVVCIPRKEAEAVLALSRAQEEKERGIQDAINGAGWDRAWVDEILRSKGCEGV
ncbi:RraA family protein [Pararhizobium haloflavum]|uniref:RraA family protein n=1 Tax=Pararhizobium haloflavum TaxID=2037914 RepID=UPI000C1A63D7|nr:RraA family protein [Pararhizobium haloflavum]